MTEEEKNRRYRIHVWMERLIFVGFVLLAPLFVYWPQWLPKSVSPADRGMLMLWSMMAELGLLTWVLHLETLRLFRHMGWDWEKTKREAEARRRKRYLDGDYDA